MNDDRGRQEHDPERLERYLQWRERTERAKREVRAARQRRWVRRAAVMLAPVIVVVGLLTWLAQNRHATRDAALHPPSAERAEVDNAPREPTTTRSEADSPPLRDSSSRRATALDAGRVAPPRQSAAEPAAVASRASPAERAAGAGSPTESAFAARKPKSRTESAAAVTSRQPAVRSGVAGAPENTSPPPATSPDRAESPDFPGAAPMPRAPVPSAATASSGTPTVAVAPSGPSESSQAVALHVAVPGVATEPRSAGAAIAKPTCVDITEALQRESPVDGSSRNQRIVDCVGGWLKGESQEFRDGFKREVEEFRTGFDRVGRGLEWLGEKLRR